MKIIRDPGQVVRISQKSASLLLKDGTKIYAKGVLFHSERLVGGYALLSFKKEKSYIEITKDKFNFLSGGDTEIGWIIENYSYNGGECQEIGEDRIYLSFVFKTDNQHTSALQLLDLPPIPLNELK